MNGEELKKSIAWNLRKARLNAGLTLTKASEKLGCAFQQIEQWESGRIFPRPQNLCDLADTYKVNVFDFFQEEKHD